MTDKCNFIRRSSARHAGRLLSGNMIFLFFSGTDVLAQNVAPLFRENRIVAYNWRLVGGRTQTYFPWGSCKESPEPKIWQHDLIREDSMPYDVREMELFKTIHN